MKSFNIQFKEKFWVFRKWFVNKICKNPNFWTKKN